MFEKTIEAIMEGFKERINEIASHMYDYLLNGNLAQFEEELYKEVTNVYNKIALGAIGAIPNFEFEASNISTNYVS